MEAERIRAENQRRMMEAELMRAEEERRRQMMAEEERRMQILAEEERRRQMLAEDDLRFRLSRPPQGYNNEIFVNAPREKETTRHYDTEAGYKRPNFDNRDQRGGILAPWAGGPDPAVHHQEGWHRPHPQPRKFEPSRTQAAQKKPQFTKKPLPAKTLATSSTKQPAALKAPANQTKKPTTAAKKVPPPTIAKPATTQATTVKGVVVQKIVKQSPNKKPVESPGKASSSAIEAKSDDAAKSKELAQKSSSGDAKR